MLTFSIIKIQGYKNNTKINNLELQAWAIFYNLIDRNNCVWHVFIWTIARGVIRSRHSVPFGFITLSASWRKCQSFKICGNFICWICYVHAIMNFFTSQQTVGIIKRDRIWKKNICYFNRYTFFYLFLRLYNV